MSEQEPTSPWPPPEPRQPYDQEREPLDEPAWVQFQRMARNLKKQSKDKRSTRSPIDWEEIVAVVVGIFTVLIAFWLLFGLR